MYTEGIYFEMQEWKNRHDPAGLENTGIEIVEELQ